MSRLEKSEKGPWALSGESAGTTLALMEAGRNGGKYRLRTMLRGALPYVLANRIPKGSRDCGNHDWYCQDDTTDACYHCEVGHRQRDDAPLRAPDRREVAVL